jgi:hypothetical protein
MGVILTALSTLAGIGATATGIAATAGAFNSNNAPSVSLPAAVDTTKANEEARQEEMRRRRTQTKTLLTGGQGALGEAETTKKVLLGA